MRMIGRSGERRDRVIGRMVEDRNSKIEKRTSPRFSNFGFRFLGFLFARSPDHQITPFRCSPDLQISRSEREFE